MSEEEYRKHCKEIGCFGLILSECFGGVCLPLKWEGAGHPTVDDCMKCHFRKQNKEQTNGVTYPFRKPRVSTRAAEAAGLFPASGQSKSVDLLATMEEVDFSYCEGCRFLSGYGNNRICTYMLEKGMRRPCRKGECKDYGIYESASGRPGWLQLRDKQKARSPKKQLEQVKKEKEEPILLSWEPDENSTPGAGIRDALDALAEEMTMEDRT